jgi:hypothetical protein
MNQTDKLELQVAENQDGSAVVQLPPGEVEDTQQEEQQIDDRDDEPRGSQTQDQDIDPEREAIRQARREERQLKKQLHRERARESNHLINALRKQNQEMAERIALIEKRTSGAELARVDKAIEDANVQVEYAKLKMADALNSRNGVEHAKAQEAWFEARRKLESLQAMKEAAAKQSQQPAQSLPDPIIKDMATRWMERNPWYDPQGQNIESTIAQKLDHQLHSEGFDPTTEDYWEELDERLKKYVPQSQNSGYNARTSQPERRRSTMTGSGRDSMPAQKPGEFILSPDRVAAMKEAGLWDNPQLRQKAIDKYRAWDRQNRNQRS